MSKKPRVKEDDEVKILEGLKAHVVATEDDEVVVETEDGRPKWIKTARLKLVASDASHQVWAELPEAA